MSSSTNKCWTDTSILPANILSLQGHDFYKVVEDLTNDTVADLIRIQAIRNVRVFMLVPDLLAVLKLDSTELENIKSRTCFRLKNSNYHLKTGVEFSLRYLRDLFAAKIHEYYHPDNKEPTDIDPNADTSSSADDNNVPFGQKRPVPSSQQISNKRGRK